jgi:hypothetical protein
MIFVRRYCDVASSLGMLTLLVHVATLCWHPLLLRLYCSASIVLLPRGSHCGAVALVALTNNNYLPFNILIIASMLKKLISVRFSD